MSPNTFDQQMRRAHERFGHIQLNEVNPQETLAQIIAAADTAEPEDLVYIGVGLIEMLLDCQGDEVADAFETALREHENLRVAYRSAAIQSDELAARFDRVAPPETDRDAGERDRTWDTVKRIDTPTLLAADDLSMQRWRRRAFGPDWVRAHLVADGPHYIRAAGTRGDEEGLVCVVLVAMDDGISRTSLLSAERSLFERLPDTLNAEEQDWCRREMGLESNSLGSWIIESKGWPGPLRGSSSPRDSPSN